jgi:hypothetical protein
MRWILALGLLGLLAGCAASGVKVSEQQAQSFKVGTSTYNDVVAALGPPTSTTVNSDGIRMAAYNYTSSRRTSFPISAHLSRDTTTNRVL